MYPLDPKTTAGSQCVLLLILRDLWRSISEELLEHRVHEHRRLFRLYDLLRSYVNDSRCGGLDDSFVRLILPLKHFNVWRIETSSGRQSNFALATAPHI